MATQIAARSVYPGAEATGRHLEFVESDPAPSRAEILSRLKRGEISAEEAIRELEALR